MANKVNLETVLHLVNRIRNVTGLKSLKTLPKGVRDSATKCVLAKALRARIDDQYAYFKSMKHADAVARMVRKGRYKNSVVMPMTLQNFVTQFDGDYFPKLEM